MPESTSTIYLVAGATRGIGLALVADIAAKVPSAIIYAGARDPVNGAAQLIQLADKYPGRIEIVKYLAADREGNDALAKVIGERHGRLDTVIANAGINYMGKIHETPIAKFADNFTINTLGPIVLFQSVRDLLKASANPRFVPISSGRGSLAFIAPGAIDTAAYGASKAALDWATRKIHFEEPWLVAYPQCPGAVDTDMATEMVSMDKTGVLAERFNKVMQPPAVAASMMVDILLASTREKDGGEFHNVEGGRHPW